MCSEAISSQVENSVKFVDAAINGPLLSDVERAALLKGLFSGSEDAVTKWVDAGADFWVRAAASATYSSLMIALNHELHAIHEKASASSTS